MLYQRDSALVKIYLSGKAVGNGETAHVLGRGVCGRSLYFLLSFALNTKLL